MNNSIPVVFFHEGNNEYLKYAILSAEKYNDNVILLGDSSNKDFSKNWYNTEEFDMKEYNEFEKLYKHMSSNTKKFEITAFKKYYMLKQYLEKSGYDKCMLLDSDIVSFCNYSELEFTKKYKASVSTQKNQENYIWTSSGHSSFFTKEYLDDFIKFCEYTYKNNIRQLEDKYKYHLENNIKGGICDMTLLYLWALNKPLIYNGAVNDNGNVFDHNINTSENYLKNEYKMSKFLRIKKIKLINGIPYFINKDGEKVRTYTLHCQGSAKMLIKDYCTQKFSLIFIHRYEILVKKFLNRYLNIKFKW